MDGWMPGWMEKTTIFTPLSTYCTSTPPRIPHSVASVMRKIDGLIDLFISLSNTMIGAWPWCAHWTLINSCIKLYFHDDINDCHAAEKKCPLRLIALANWQNLTKWPNIQLEVLFMRFQATAVFRLRLGFQSLSFLWAPRRLATNI